MQRGPPGIGFKYLDGSGNFDIGKKRLTNVAKPEEKFDAVNKYYFDKSHDFLHDLYDRFRITFYNYLTKLDDLKESYDQFITAHNQYKADKENTLNTHNAILDRLFENQVTNKDALNNLERIFNEKIVIVILNKLQWVIQFPLSLLK